ncbi:MAG: hypothetical protein ACJZZG_03595 [Cytophagales bacterium]|nr:hypothetical protein [Marinoscillum sp.]OUX27075.1 MAG: hypothetical protein CBE22_00800 [Flammeovirgaceae bacterium TMED262]|tara:strand:+ start:810 stop:1043 length:234 start_codon:yes stop_codon:yes gene_type:complete
MNYDPNLTILLGILVNGMITVFSVLFLVFILSKIFISIVSKLKIKEDNGDEVEKAIKDKISELSGGKGTLIKYTKIS